MNAIKSIEISRLFGDTQIQWHLQKTNVLVGKNGMGKSTILQLIVNAISQEPVYDKSNLCADVTLRVHPYGELVMKNSKKNISDLLNSDEISILRSSIIEDINKINEIPIDIKNDILHKLIGDDIFFKPNNMIEFSSSKKIKKIDYEFISTINLNANSLQNISMGDGRTTNILDWEIQNELNRLIRIRDEKINQDFISSLNVMFGESNKIVYFDDDFELKFKFNNQILDFSQLSSGERQVIYILLKVAIATKNNALILMDEPEISLHLSWQEKLLTQIRTINPDSQIIIVTHSPAIVMNGWLDCFVDIKDITTKG